MFRYRKITVILCLFVMLFNVFSLSAFAVYPVDFIGVVSGVVGLFDYVHEATGTVGLLEGMYLDYFAHDGGCTSSPDGNHNWEYASASLLLDNCYRLKCKHCGMMYNDYSSNAYNDAVEDMVHNVEDNTGNTMLSVSADVVVSFYYYASRESAMQDPDSRIYADAYSLSLPSLPASFVVSNKIPVPSGAYSSKSYCVWTSSATLSFYAPVPGRYSLYHCNNSSPFVVKTFEVNEPCTCSYFVENFFSSSAIPKTVTRNYNAKFVGALPTPSPDQPNPADLRINQNFNFNLLDVNNNVSNNVTIVNENNNTYHDIETDVDIDINKWSYDYKSRTYSLTLANGDLVLVVFGDEFVTVIKGDDVKFYYYYLPNVDPTPSPEPTDDPDPTEDPDPTPTPSPTPFPSGGDDVPPPGGDIDIDADGFFAWLKAWLINFKLDIGSLFRSIIDKLQLVFDITSNIGDNIENITENVENITNNTSIETETNINIDYDFDNGQLIIIDNSKTVTGEDGEEHPEERPFNIKTDFFRKFLVFKDIFDIGTGVVSLVSSDAAYAYDFNLASVAGNDETMVMQSDLYMSSAPSVPRLEINLGAASSHFGFNYGSTTAVLDFSWYTPYKQDVDNLLSGFLWLGFAWSLFKKAPGILGGVGLSSERIEDIGDGKRGKR